MRALLPLPSIGAASACRGRSAARLPTPLKGRAGTAPAVQGCTAGGCEGCPRAGAGRGRRRTRTVTVVPACASACATGAGRGGPCAARSPRLFPPPPSPQPPRQPAPAIHAGARPARHAGSPNTAARKGPRGGPGRHAVRRASRSGRRCIALLHPAASAQAADPALRAGGSYPGGRPAPPRRATIRSLISRISSAGHRAPTRGAGRTARPGGAAAPGAPSLPAAASLMPGPSARAAPRTLASLG